MNTEAQRGRVGLAILAYWDTGPENSKTNTEKEDPQRGRMASKVNHEIIPDRFLDPVHGHLMVDPVFLPTSKITVDREVIERFLRDFSSDPFNRQHLTKNMLISHVSLKAEIESFIESKKNSSQEQNMQSTTNKTMQTGKATYQSSPGAQNDNAPIETAILCNAQARNMDTDVNLENIPMEFRDPFVLTLMEDPVVLPSGKRMDRAVIKDHISMFHIDPFNGAYLTEDMLVSDDYLKTRIKDFISSSQGQIMQSTSKETLQTGAASYQSSPVAQNYSDPNNNNNNNNNSVLAYPPRAKFDVDVSHVRIPKEFLDPHNLPSGIMVDPVVLPSGYRLGRSSICELIRDYPVDPFSGRYLTEDMFLLDVSLKKRIEEFVSYSQGQSMRSTSKETLQTGTATYQISPGAQNDSDPNNNSRTIFDPEREKLDDVNPKNIPAEFLDPLVLTLMEDPVVLPSSFRVDRAVIRKHIYEFNVDPFSGRYLTEDMLVSDDYLRTRIEEFISSSQGQSMQNTSMETRQTGTASYHSSLGARNDSDPNNNSIIPFDINDIPMAFLDSLEDLTLMKDPVILPSFKRVDRAVIQNRISKLRVDPFSGRYLTDDMLVPDGNLKTRIEEFIARVTRSENEQNNKTKKRDVMKLKRIGRNKRLKCLFKRALERRKLRKSIDRVRDDKHMCTLGLFWIFADFLLNLAYWLPAYFQPAYFRYLQYSLDFPRFEKHKAKVQVRKISKIM